MLLLPITDITSYFIAATPMILNDLQGHLPIETFHEIWTQQRQAVSLWKLSEQNFENVIMGLFQKRRKKILTKFPGLATSVRHNSAMITDHPKLTTKIAIGGMSSFNFYH